MFTECVLMWVRRDRGLGMTVAVLVTLVLWLAAPSAMFASPLSPSGVNSGRAQDNDGDYLDDVMDPDDDNDGVPDMYDAAPFDATIGTQPTPGPLDPNVDTDSDGIPNVQDPDSDQDGVADEDDPAPLDPSPVPPPTIGDPAPSGGDPAPSAPPAPETAASAPAPSGTDTDGRPLVLALPSTGAGTSMSLPFTGMTALAAIATALLLIGWRARRPHGR